MSERISKRNQLMKLILDNDARIKSELSKVYPKGIPSNVLRNAREFGIYIDGDQFNLRTGIDTKYTFGGIDVKLSGVTKYAETVDSANAGRNVKIKNPSFTALTRGKASGMFSTAEELRRWKSTGTWKGKFIDNLINKQGNANELIDELKSLRNKGEITTEKFDAGMRGIFKKINQAPGRSNVKTQQLVYDPSKWNKYGTPIGADGTLKTPANFLKAMNKNWKDQGLLNKLIKTKTGWEIHRGHGIASESFGPNIFNVAPQPALATTFKGSKGLEGLSANIAQGGQTIKRFGDLRQANIPNVKGRSIFNLSAAYNEWAMDTPNVFINRFRDLSLKDQVRTLHDPSVTASEMDIIGRRPKSRIFKNKSNTLNILKLIKKGSGKVKDITFGKTPRGTLTRGVGLYSLLSMLDPSEATEQHLSEIVKGTNRSPEKIQAAEIEYSKDIGSVVTGSLALGTGMKLASYIPIAKTAVPFVVKSAAPITIPIGMLMLFDSYDNIFHDGEIKQWFKENDPGRAQAEGAALTSSPGDFDYKPNARSTFFQPQVEYKDKEGVTQTAPGLHLQGV